jgi:hypothetical protein
VKGKKHDEDLAVLAKNSRSVTSQTHPAEMQLCEPMMHGMSMYDVLHAWLYLAALESLARTVQIRCRRSALATFSQADLWRKARFSAMQYCDVLHPCSFLLLEADFTTSHPCSQARPQSAFSFPERISIRLLSLQFNLGLSNRRKLFATLRVAIRTPLAAAFEPFDSTTH